MRGREAGGDISLSRWWNLRRPRKLWQDIPRSPFRLTASYIGVDAVGGWHLYSMTYICNGTEASLTSDRPRRLDAASSYLCTGFGFCTFPVNAWSWWMEAPKKKCCCEQEHCTQEEAVRTYRYRQDRYFELSGK